jgi:signal transduction histidine kinase
VDVAALLGAGVIGLTVGAVLATVLIRRKVVRQVAALQSRVEGWIGATHPEPIPQTGGAAWTRLATALNTLGRSYRDRDAALSRERPWRLELVEALAQPALLFNADGRLQALNVPARTMIGLADGIPAMTVTEALASTAITSADTKVRSDRRPLILDVERAGRDLRVSVSLIGDETLVLLADRTRERQIEDLRRDFVVNASHELKTPVTSIQTLADALSVTLRDDPARASGLVIRLNDEAARLAQLVTDLLDLRRLEDAGPLERVPVDLASIVRRVVADIIPRAEQRGITFDLELPDAARVAGLAPDLEAVVKNLVSNAVKYNRDGGIVTVRLRTVDGAQRLSVADTGIGIRQQDQPRVFERFYRADTARSRETGGTGLGLAIVRHAVERHGGIVTVESALGEGTTFTVTIPIDTHA